MTHIAIIGAGITGVTTAYALLERGYKVTVLDKHRYAAMETSFANGGQLSASNAEVWNSAATILKGLRWMFRRDAPLLMNPRPNWHKYSWMSEFVANIGNYRANTIQTTRLAIEARKLLFEIAAREGIEFDLERRGILHIYHDKKGFESGLRVNALLQEGGLDRRPVTAEEIRNIEPTLRKEYYGGFFTPSDATGDIHKFTRGLAEACKRRGATFVHEANIDSIAPAGAGYVIGWADLAASDAAVSARGMLKVDGVVVCAGVASRHFATLLNERVNVYPVKGYSITVQLDTAASRNATPTVSLLDEAAKIVTSRLGADRFRVAGTAEFNDFNRDIRADRVQPLVDWVRSNFPDVETSRVVPWAGLRPMMPDMMPVVRAGRLPGVFFNTGHGHLGWTLSAATAQMIAATIDGWRGLNAPSTVPALRGEHELRRAS
ncbi:D-amino acid dehydrogenase [Bradyrhizobium symbiodeficiens]|uniref:D-amino acid dehydrogenase n=1 Tax=Bradyrhizobium symbiodeficiens TaxID=1404367 RepID=UPI000BA1A3B7|nr:D-amino acid dehydrogenase [Bradyrhizobium symbiodeficiens]AWM08376.1 D-amino acid dehydrogenase [Bradyrhizobium symbiodeficiens]